MTDPLLQTRVPPAVMRKAEREAAAAGLSMAAWLRTVVLAHLQGGSEVKRRLEQLEGRISDLERHTLAAKGNGDGT